MYRDPFLYFCNTSVTYAMYAKNIQLISHNIRQSEVQASHLKPGLHFDRKGKQKINALLFFFFSRPGELRQNSKLKMLNFFCFSRCFPCETANRIRLGSERPKHKQHGFARRYEVFYYGSCLV